MKCYFTFILIIIIVPVFSQEAINPVISPAIFGVEDEIEITYDVTDSPLAGLSESFLWMWLPGKNTDATSNVNPANSDSDKTAIAKFTKTVDGDNTFFSITLVPSEYFSEDISDATEIGLILKGNDWSDGQTSDFITDISDGSFILKLLAPTSTSIFVTTNDEITIVAEVTENANFKLFKEDVVISEEENSIDFQHTLSVTEVSGAVNLRLEAVSGTNSKEITFQYVISVSSPELTRPEGIIPGINFHMNDPTKVYLAMLAPGKTSMYAIGDFSDWQIKPENLMYKDDEIFWIELEGLTEGTEYAFQYLIDESLYVADPFADKILDPDDRFIPADIYPNLKPFPEGLIKEQWYFNRQAVFQTGQTPFNWTDGEFQRPKKEKLVIYEILLRDFFSKEDRSYKNLTDTLGYLKELGINAIELMPIMEFNGNEGWGYNPTFMFAPDKYYGTKDDFKAFINKCHQEGIAVILDIAMNHHDVPNPFVMMDFDFTTFKPTSENKWFNVDARHPFNVFFDMNHQSEYTKNYLDTVNNYWMDQYHVDGFRFDLSKGFTQTNNPENVQAWSSYDATRITLLKRMADEIWSHDPGIFIILEHFADNEEEKELAEYRSEENKGMMVWGNANHAFNQNTMGYEEDSDIDWIYHGSRGWSTPHVIGYMESHDEERLMYRNQAFGNSFGDYDASDEITGLDRIKAASVLFYTIPGPKMIWQFGEMGFDQSINRCEDGSIDEGCRLSPKPVLWSYLENSNRFSLHNLTADLLRLRHEFEIFSDGIAEIVEDGLIKQVSLVGDPFTPEPQAAEEMNVKVVTNFELSNQGISVEFPHEGIWYDYYAGGEEIEVTSIPFNVSVNAGGYKLFTDYPIEPYKNIVTGLNAREKMTFDIFPNPVQNYFTMNLPNHENNQVMIYDLRGRVQQVKSINHNRWDISLLKPGIYVIKVNGKNKSYSTKLIKY